MRLFFHGKKERMNKMLFVFRVTAGQEKIVADMVSRVARNNNIRSIIVFDNYDGYIIVEADDMVHARKAAGLVRHVKGVLAKPLSLEEIEKNFGVYVPQIVKIGKGDIVELTGGSFKGDKAKVIRVDPIKNQVTIELTDIAVPIPITLNSNMVKVIQKAEQNIEEEKDDQKEK
ncbi:MAG: transcription elongation factor Spt5 [Candidatus Micrarchaeota archaeon]|nr:transcription elongation factor Spt5 [Candidatus Micrarchaeota archaeon]